MWRRTIHKEREVVFEDALWDGQEKVRMPQPTVRPTWTIFFIWEPKPLQCAELSLKVDAISRLRPAGLHKRTQDAMAHLSIEDLLPPTKKPYGEGTRFISVGCSAVKTNSASDVFPETREGRYAESLAVLHS